MWRELRPAQRPVPGSAGPACREQGKDAGIGLVFGLDTGLEIGLASLSAGTAFGAGAQRLPLWRCIVIGIGKGQRSSMARDLFMVMQGECVRRRIVPPAAGGKRGRRSHRIKV
jgi:hypothetical protein